MQVLAGGCEPPVWGRGGRTGLEMGSMSRQVVTSYRLPIVTIGLSFTVFAVLRNWSSKRRQYTKVHRLPKIDSVKCAVVLYYYLIRILSYRNKCD